MTTRLKYTKKDIVELPLLLRQILASRGVTDDDEVLAFINPSYENTDYDPFQLPDMDKAVDRLLLAAKNGEQVTIYCDYDVDGTTGATVLLDALPRFNIKVNYYVPDRFKEGYGLNVSAIDYLKQNGTDVPPSKVREEKAYSLDSEAREARDASRQLAKESGQTQEHVTDISDKLNPVR